MRVLHIGSHCIAGGAEAVMADLVRSELAAGIRSEVVFHKDYGAADQFPAASRVRFLERGGIRRLLLDNRYDVINCCAHSAEWASIPIRDSHYGGAVVVTSHSVGDYPSDVLQANLIVAVSDMAAGKILELTGRRSRVLHNGVDTGLFHPPAATLPAARRTVAWVARSADTRKGLDLLLGSIANGLFDAFDLCVVDGSPPGMDCGAALPISARMFRGLSRGNMPGVYRRAAETRGFFLSTSSEESCPMTILEAMACGCPVIVPSVGGIPEIVQHRVTGCLFDRGKAGALREAIDWLYDAGNYDRVAMAALNNVRQHHALASVCRAYRQAYRMAILRRLPRRVISSLQWHLTERNRIQS